MAEIRSQYEFVQLERIFHELSKNARQGDEIDIRAFHVGKPLGWDDLVKEFRLIVLSEAGSGKTTEIMNVAKRLRDQSLSAFFLRLEHIPDNFEDAFEVGTYEAFEAWLSSGEEGWLFLDSVDEARLRDPGDFELAIRKLGRRILTAKDRAHICITGRTTAWRPKTDLTLCIQHFPFTPATIAETAPNPSENEGDFEDHFAEEDIRTQKKPGDTKSEVFKIVALDDLSSDQIKIFAIARGVTDAEKFVDAIERADAWSFTARPQDLEELTQFWVDKGRIGSRLEIMRNSIVRRLEERDQDRADARPLSAQRAREGARLVAAAATLIQEATIRVPDGAANDKGISLRVVLPDWDDRDLAALLSRPIFDEAIYGTVRFHHRSVREYLAAEWFADLLAKQTSRRAIEGLFFRKQYGIDVIVPAMRPILPWLAILDEKIRERLRQTAPEVIFEGGDPSQLPIETRQYILQEACEQIANGTSGSTITDYASVQRFANSDLTEDINELLERYCDNQDLIGFLLRMVWLGQLTGALPKAKQVALSASGDHYTRIAAIRAVRAIGDVQDQEDVRQAILQQTDEIDRDWLAEVAEDTPATEAGIDWLLGALRKTESKPPFSVDHLTDKVVSYADKLNISQLPKFVAGLADLLDDPPFVERRYCEVSKQFSWLMKAAGLSVERLAKARHTGTLQSPALSVVHRLPMVREYTDAELRDTRFEFSKLVPAWPELNRSAFWYAIETSRKLREQKEQRVTEFWHASIYGAFWKFEGEEDFNYAVQQITERPYTDDKLVALSLAYRLYIENDRPRRWREQLGAAATMNVELSERLAGYLNPPPQSEEERNFKRREAAWRRQAEERKKKKAKNREDWKKLITENVASLRAPKLDRRDAILRTQCYLHEVAREKAAERSNRWTEGNWQILIPEFGEEIATAYRDGVVAYWRRHRPKLLSEGAKPNTTAFSVIFGLTGLQIEAQETPDWAGQLPDEEVELACRYAMHELNGFPTWFPRLFDAHPELVSEFLIQEIRYELSIEEEEKETYYVLGDLSWSGGWAWETLGPDVLEILKTDEPRNTSTLRKLLKILQGSGVSDDAIRSLACIKANDAARARNWPAWFAVWVGVDPDVAIPALSACIDTLSTDADRVLFAMKFITELVSARTSESANVRTAYRTPRYLKTLYILMHQHIRQRDDIDRVGSGVYSPELRDVAQDSRNSLFPLLNNIPGKEAFLAIQEIAADHPEEKARSYFIHHAKVKAEQDANISPWTPLQVQEFHQRLDRTPNNHRDLAELAVMRLLDMKDDLEEGDSSVAAILKPVTLETDMRKYIGHELREKAFNRYSIPQEEELADAKKPDLRFHGATFDGPVPVELKLADKWTGPDLFERLENQLCGDYLRDSRSNRGIFVLVYKGEKVGWDLPGGSNRVDFDGLVSALQNHWSEISPQFPGVEEISVVGIDLTKRSEK